MPPKVKGKRKRETIKPISGLDVDALLGLKKRETISQENSIPEFKQMLAAADELSTIEHAAKQMGMVIRSIISDSFADIKYDRAAENLRVMREELINMEEPGLYNSFLRDLKKKLHAGDLNGDRREMWREKIIPGRLNLITERESEASDVTEEDAKNVSYLPALLSTLYGDYMLTKSHSLRSDAMATLYRQDSERSRLTLNTQHGEKALVVFNAGKMRLVASLGVCLRGRRGLVVPRHLTYFDAVLFVDS